MILRSKNIFPKQKLEDANKFVHIFKTVDTYWSQNIKKGSNSLNIFFNAITLAITNL